MMEIIPRSYEGETAVIIATGPSINKDQISAISDAKSRDRVRIITINNAYQIAPFTDIQVACNHNWWQHYLENDHDLKNLKSDCWTRLFEWEKRNPKREIPQFLKDYDTIKLIDVTIKDGLSTDPSLVHFNHGSGPMALNIATLYGFKKIILVGHDMKFARDYDGANGKVGSTPRHYFGEYPKSMQHFPRSKNSVDENGVIVGLIKVYESTIRDLINMNVDVVNCTPNSALNCFRKSTLESEL